MTYYVNRENYLVSHKQVTRKYCLKGFTSSTTSQFVFFNYLSDNLDEMKFLIILSLCVFETYQYPELGFEQKWIDFITLHQKKYENEEKTEDAKLNLAANFDRVSKHNCEWAAKKVTYNMELYEFSDMPVKDAIKLYCGTELPRTSRALPKANGKPSSFPSGPTSIDWRSVLLPVVSQGVRENKFDFILMTFKANFSTTFSVAVRAGLLQALHKWNLCSREKTPRTTVHYRRNTWLTAVVATKDAGE